MNRRTLLASLLSGLTAGVAAIAGRKTAEPVKRLHDGGELSIEGKLTPRAFNADLHDNHGYYRLNPGLRPSSVFPKNPVERQKAYSPNGEIFMYTNGTWVRCFSDGKFIAIAPDYA